MNHLPDNKRRPKLDANELAYYDINSTASLCDCTGLIPTPIHTEAEADAYQELYPIPAPVVKKRDITD
ncbi:MAG: hypothetical protein Q4B99_03395 [Clostridia bacterium]|nr:hypothetical protein [Clostridia bacterium]